MDSLRYWVTEMHVDGFRFDLASALARELHSVDRLSAFFDLIHQDPVVSQVKLIAEPWDVGDGGYQVGNFPVLWSEWNGRYRDTLRDFWRGEPGTLGDVGYRLTGSSDLYESNGRRPFASVNFVTAHDGFTLRDLVSYNEKHNEANGEDNRDGETHNRSWNSGAEGRHDRPEPSSPSVPGSSATSWPRCSCPRASRCSWAATRSAGRSTATTTAMPGQRAQLVRLGATRDAELFEFTRRLIAFRHAHPVLRRRRFFQGRPIHGEAIADIEWYAPDGSTMNDEDWGERMVRSIGLLLNGDGLPDRDERGAPVRDDTFYVAAPRGPGRCRGVHPRRPRDACGGSSSTPPTRCRSRTSGDLVPAGAGIPIAGRSVILLRREPPREGWGTRPSTPRATYRLQLREAFDVRRRRGGRCRTSPRSACQPRSTCRRSSSGARQHARLRRRRPRPGRRRARRRGRLRALLRGARRRRARAWCSTSCPTTWRSRPGNPWWWDVLENGRASRYARLFRRRVGPARGPAPRPRADARSWATTTGGCSRRASCGCCATRAGSSSATTTTAAGRRRGRSTSCWHRGGAARRSDELGVPRRRGRRPAAGRSGRRRRGRPARTATKRVLAALLEALRERAGRRLTRSKRWSRRSTPTSDRSTRCSSGRTTGSPGGAPRARDLGYRRFFDVDDAGRPARRG